MRHDCGGDRKRRPWREWLGEEDHMVSLIRKVEEFLAYGQAREGYVFGFPLQQCPGPLGTSIRLT